MSGDEKSEVQDLDRACREARHVLDQQIEKIHREDQKAIKMFRVNLLFLAVLTSGFSVVVRQDSLQIAAFRNTHLILGLVTICFSTVLAAMAYTSSKFSMGFNAQFLEDTQDANQPASFDDLIDKYSTWLRRNQRVHRQNTAAINWIIILAISSVLFFIGGFGVGLVDARGTNISDVLLAFELVASFTMGLFVYKSNQIFDLFTSSSDTL